MGKTHDGERPLGFPQSQEDSHRLKDCGDEKSVNETNTSKKVNEYPPHYDNNNGS